jgi:hypothetical protein
VTKAQTTCFTPLQSIVIFFGNGIATSPESAKRSAVALQRTIGDSYNGQKVRYDLAYNKTSGIAVDLIQSAAQALFQWDSQLMGWLNGVGVAPGWFNQWYQNFLLSFTTVAASELPEHVSRYGNAIALGQKVVVVSHSQGNFYVNEAKKLLQQKIPAEKMNSFAIFGVAVPANNIGDAAGPYYTNHRDFIYAAIPGALPQNWTLKRVNGNLAQDVGPVQAHFFNETYLSSDFDIRPALISGINAQMNVAQQPSPDCSTYRPDILSMVKGSYEHTCRGRSEDTPKLPIVVTSQGVTSEYGDFLDMNGPDSILYLAWDEEVGTALDNVVTWDKNGAVKYSGCPPGALPSKINIAEKMMALIEPKYYLFPSGRCMLIENGQSIFLPLTPVIISGTTLHAASKSWDFVNNLKSESVVPTRGVGTGPPDYDPGFTLINIDGSKAMKSLEYRRMKGLRRVFVSNQDPLSGARVSLLCDAK